jgi:mRNA interferase HigB
VARHFSWVRYDYREAPVTRSLATTRLLPIFGHTGHKGIKAARSQYQAWLDIVTRANWRSPEDVKASYPKASILKAGRVVSNIKGNDYRLIAAIQYQAGVLAVRFFGSHAEYDRIDAEAV